MIKKIDFKKLFLPALIFCGAVLVVGLFMLLVFGGKTYAEYTLRNLRFGYFIKAGVSLLFVFILTSLYFFIRFKKKGLWLGVFSVASASLNSLIAFFLCVIFRANLGEPTFALILLCVLFTYVTSLIFALNAYSHPSNKKSKNKQPVSVGTHCKKTFRVMLLPILLAVFVTVVSCVISLFFGAFAIALYALPVIVSVASCVVLTLTFACKFLKA